MKDEITKVDISKVDATTGKEIEGAKLTLKDKKTGEQVLFAAVPNRETNILAYSDSAHKANKTVTFGKFRIFCFIKPENNSYTDLLVDSEKIHLEKTKRKVCTL